MSEEFTTMREIGKLYVGGTSHKVGRELKDLNYRDQDGRPTKRAFDEGMTQQRFYDEGKYQWVWHAGKVCDLLETFGWKRKVNDDGTE